MNYGEIKYCDIANGEGVRTSLFVSGCTHCCVGCFQSETWDFDYGEPFTKKQEDEILKSLSPVYVDGLSILGGEPMEPQNQRELLPFLKRVKEEFPDKSIWLFTGDTYEALIDENSLRHIEVTSELLSLIDILVDGLFIQDLYQCNLRFKGSTNQRIIDVPKSLETGFVQLWQDEPQYAKREFELSE